MKCQRCIRGKEAAYRVYSDVIEMKVCPACAAEARRLGITSELLHRDVVAKGGANGGFSGSERAMLVLVGSSAT